MNVPVPAVAPRKHTEVAVGILLRSDGALLLSTRPPGKPYAGYWEFPGGKLEEGETVEQVAQRESEEEAGLKLTEFWPMLSYQSSPGGSTERIYLVLARLTEAVETGVYGLASEQEDIKVHSLSRQTAMQLLLDGKIDNAATVIALQWLALNLDKVRKGWAE
mgnify:CR=1 FL=1